MPDGTRKSCYGSTRQEVVRRLKEFQRDLDRGITTPRDGRQTISAYLDSWLVTKQPEIEPSSWLRCEQYVRLHIKLEDGVAPNTVRHMHATLHTALEDALRIDLVIRNVAGLVRPPKAPHLEMKTYTPEQAIQLLDAAKGDRLEALYVLMLTSACRLGELLGLQWTAIDFERGEMKITSALKEVSNHRSLGRPKTPRSKRTIPLTPVAVASLRRHRAQQMEEKLASPLADWNQQDLVFVTTNGTAYARTNWRFQQYIRLIERAGLPYIRPHDLRHTAATLRLLEGVQPLVVSEMLGHSAVAFTLQTHGHVQAEMRKPARDAMERLFGGVFDK